MRFSILIYVIRRNNMKKIITLIIIGLLFTACDFKAHVVMPEQFKDEKELIVLRHKIEMAEKEIAMLETINESIEKGYGSKYSDKIYSKASIKSYYILDSLNQVHYHSEIWEMEIVKNSERIYDLLGRIQMWNDAIYKFY